LGKQQSDALATVEAMQKDPLRNWNGKYDLGVTQVKQIASKLEKAIAHKQQKEHQLGQWDKQAKAHQAWNKDPQTIEMRSLLEGLKSPQAMERLVSINQKLPLRQAQFQLISVSGAVFGERKIYYTAEAALRAGLEWFAQKKI